MKYHIFTECMQDPFRHPGPSSYMQPGQPNPMLFHGATQNGVQPMEIQSQSPKHHHMFQQGAGPSKIPVFGAGKHFDEVNKKISFSAPSRTNTLPPIVGNSDEKGGTNSRGHSNPEKNKKYAQNPR